MNINSITNWKIYDLQGIELLSGKSEAINVSELNPGSYLIRMEQENQFSLFVL